VRRRARHIAVSVIAIAALWFVLLGVGSLASGDGFAGFVRLGFGLLLTMLAASGLKEPPPPPRDLGPWS